MAEPNHADGPLAGVRILDFTWAWAGPHGTLLLSLLGAEVFKVESKKRLDHTRLRSLMGGPQLASPDHSAIFNDLNVGKRSVALDLTKPEAREIARKLAAHCDVVTSNMRPGALERLGLAYEDMRKVKEDIIMISSSAVGATGPERTYAGYAPTFAALSGLSYVTGHADGPPHPLTGAVDLRVGTTCALAVLAALYHRRRTGQGQHIDVSSAEVVSALIGGVFMEQSMNGRSPMRAGNNTRATAPHNCYPCLPDEPEIEDQDVWELQRWVTIVAASDNEWGALCRSMGEPALEKDARFADVVSRVRNREELDAIISAWTRHRSADDVAETLQAAGVPAVPVLHGPGLTKDRHISARDVLAQVQHPILGSRQVLGVPWRLSETPAAVRAAGPLIGEGNEYVLGDVLGLSSEEIEQLDRDGVLN